MFTCSTHAAFCFSSLLYALSLKRTQPHTLSVRPLLPYSIPVSCLKTKWGLHKQWSAWRRKVSAGQPRTSVVLSLWIQTYIQIGSSTQWPIAPWHTSWCQKDWNSRLQITVCNNSTHLYWFDRRKRTDQFSVLCIVGVSLCILLVCLSKIFEITCVQH